MARPCDIMLAQKGQRQRLPLLLYTCPSKSRKCMDPICFTEQEWFRLNNSLRKQEIAAAKLAEFQATDEERRLRSQKLMESWPDNPQAKKELRFEALHKKLEREEAERVKLDLQEREYQAKQHREAVERAKQLLFSKTEKVQRLNKAFLASCIEKEREEQIRSNQCRQLVLKKMEEAYDNEILNNSLKVKQLLQYELCESKKQAKQWGEDLKQQIKQKHDRALREMEIAKAELEATQKVTKNFLAAVEEQERQKKLRAKEEVLGFRQQQIQKEILDNYAKEIEMIEDKKTQAFLVAKRKMRCECQKREEITKRDKRKQQEHAVNHLANILQKASDIEAENYNKAVAEKEELELQRLKQEAEKRERMKREKILFDQESKNNADKLKRKEIALQVAEMKRVIADYELYNEQEQRKFQDKQVINTEVEKDVKKQIDEVQKRRKDEANAQDLQYRYQSAYYKNYDAEVEAYTQKLMKEAEKKCWPIRPLLVAKHLNDQPAM